MPSSFAPFRRFYQQGGYVKPKETKRQREERIRMALYGSQFWPRYASGGHADFQDKHQSFIPDIAEKTDYAGGGSAIARFLAKLNNWQGDTQVQRMVRAADEGLLGSYSDKGLRALVNPDQPKLFTSMPPGDFENFAQPIHQEMLEQVPYSRFDNFPRLARPPMVDQTYDRYIANTLDRLGNRTSDDSPTLWLHRNEENFDPTTDVVGHEGRHRLRAMDLRGDPRSLIELQPHPQERGFVRSSDPAEMVANMQERYLGKGEDRMFTPQPRVADPFAWKESDVYAPRDPVVFPYHTWAGGGPVRAANPKAANAFLRLLGKYKDPVGTKIDEWKWRPLGDVASELPREVPPHVEDFGDYMKTMSDRAGSEGLSPRDILKGYTTTLSSIQRQAINRDSLPGLALSSGDQMIRPEGAFSDWLGSPMGQKYLRFGAEGEAHPEAIADAMSKLGPYGLMPTLGERMASAPGIVSGKEGRISELVDRAARGASDPSEWREAVGDFTGIGPSKAGFMASLLGRGDIPTLDARQIILHSGQPTAFSKPYLKPNRAIDAVDRLAARQSMLGLDLRDDLSPYYQHLAHHTIWDAVGDEATTHRDVMDSMLNRAKGGPVHFETGGGAALRAFRKLLGSAPRSEVDLVNRAAQESGRSTEDIVNALRSKVSGIKGDTVTERGITSLKGREPIEEAMARIINPKTFDRPELTPEDLVGHVGVAGMADRTAAGQLVTHIGGQKLDRPIMTQSGPDFPLYHPELWAADKGAISAFANAVKPYDKPALFMTKAMGPQSLDQSHMMMEAVSQLLGDAPVSGKDAGAFNRYVRGMGQKDPKTGEMNYFLPKFPGIKSENLSEWLLDQPMSERAQLVKAMDTGMWNEKGIPNPTAARLALTDPHLYTTPTNTPGRTIGRFDPSNPYVMDPEVPHPSYPVGLRGEFLGGLDRALPWQSVFPDFAAKVAGKAKAQADRSYMLSPVTQDFNQQWLEKVMPVWEAAPKQWARGGRATKDDYAKYWAMNMDWDT
jgi:hypothetical protein